VVFARLILDEGDVGVHNFIVPIRDMDTHEPLPGEDKTLIKCCRNLPFFEEIACSCWNASCMVGCWWTGVHLGDVGAKMGLNGIDNGYLQFDHVRVPKEHMLSR